MKRLFFFLLLALGSLGAPAQGPATTDSAEVVRPSRTIGGMDPAEWERRRKEADKAWGLVKTGILCSAAIFCVWAALYKKRYRELHTRGGVYRGIGSKYFHDHYETEHYGDGHNGVSPGADPWCYNDYHLGQGEACEKRRAGRRAGGGASTRW